MLPSAPDTCTATSPSPSQATLITVKELEVSFTATGILQESIDIARSGSSPSVIFADTLASSHHMYQHFHRQHMPPFWHSITHT